MGGGAYGDGSGGGSGGSYAPPSAGQSDLSDSPPISPPPPDDEAVPDPSTTTEDAAAQVATAAVETILSVIESGAALLLSTAANIGLSNPFGSTQGGWDTSPEVGNQYSGFVAADGANPNAFTGTENVNPFSGSPNAGAFAEAGGPQGSDSPQMYPLNDPIPAAIASETQQYTVQNVFDARAEGSDAVSQYAADSRNSAPEDFSDADSNLKQFNITDDVFWDEEGRLNFVLTNIGPDDEDSAASSPSASTAAGPATDTPVAPTQAEQSESSQDEENWNAAKAGMQDSAVDLIHGLLSIGPVNLLEPLGPLGPELPLDWAKAGPPAPTGDPNRDARLLDNYKHGGWVTNTIAAAAPIGAEGLLDSALSAAGRALGGMGIGGAEVADELPALGNEINGSLPPEVPKSPPTEGEWVLFARSKKEADAFRQTVEQIEGRALPPPKNLGGPKPNGQPGKWGSAFGNRPLQPGRAPELPPELAPFKEYTTLLPGQQTRGTLRVVSGDGEALFNTWTHYGTDIPWTPIDPSAPLPRVTLLRFR
jgi:hypothetical protein